MPTPEEKKQAPAKSRKRLLAALLSGTILATGALNAGAQTMEEAKTPAPLTDAEVQKQVDISGNKYTREQAEIRAISAKSGKFNYPERSEKLSFVFSNCAQADYSAEQVPEGVRNLWDNMQLLKNSQTLMGPAIAGFSVKANIFYCNYKMNPDTMGIWYGSDGIVRINPDYDRESFFLSQTHETIHGIQKYTGSSDENMTWAIREFQISILSYEAAARTGEILIALDFHNRQQDIDSKKSWHEVLSEHFIAEIKHTLNPWKVAKRLYTDETETALRAYNAATKENKPYGEAMSAAGEAAFYNQFKKQEWLDYYNNQTLTEYIHLMLHGNLHPPSGDQYNIERARKTGYISEEFNFTAGLDKLPDYDDLFGNNKAMRQAFDYVDAERLAYTIGADTPDYLKRIEQLRQQKNPYLDVDLHQVQAIIENPDNTDRPLKIMNCLAGLECQVPARKSNPAP